MLTVEQYVKIRTAKCYGMYVRAITARIKLRIVCADTIKRRAIY